MTTRTWRARKSDRTRSSVSRIILFMSMGSSCSSLRFRKSVREVSDHLRGAKALRDDVVADRPQLGEIDRLATQDLLHRFGVAEDGGQRLIHLVCDRRGKLPQRRDAAHVAKGGAVPLGLQLGELAAVTSSVTPSSAAVSPPVPASRPSALRPPAERRGTRRPGPRRRGGPRTAARRLRDPPDAPSREPDGALAPVGGPPDDPVSRPDRWTSQPHIESPAARAASGHALFALLQGGCRLRRDRRSTSRVAISPA